MNVRKVYFDHDEFLAMRAVLPEQYLPLLPFAYHTGCRKGEARIISMAPEVCFMLVMQNEYRGPESGPLKSGTL